MAEISRVALFGKLNPTLYKALEGATVVCKLRGNPYVEIAHWLHQILQNQDSDLHRIVRRFELGAAQLARDLTESLERLPRGATSISDLSEHIENAVERGWVYASLMFSDSQVRGATLVFSTWLIPYLSRISYVPVFLMGTTLVPLGIAVTGAVTGGPSGAPCRRRDSKTQMNPL